MMKKKIIPGFLAGALTVSGLFVVPAVSVEAAEDSHPVRLIDYANCWMILNIRNWSQNLTGQ